MGHSISLYTYFLNYYNQRVLLAACFVLYKWGTEASRVVYS